MSMTDKVEKMEKAENAGAAAEQSSHPVPEAGMRPGILGVSREGYASDEAFNRRVYDASRDVPKEAIKPIDGGKLRGMSSINSMWRIKKLMELFGPCGIGWNYSIVHEERLPVHDEILLLLTIELTYRLPDESWSQPITGVGSSKLVVKDRSGINADTDAYKKALTDAISVVCKMLGIGANVYFEGDDESKYSEGPAMSQPFDPVGMAQKIEFAAAEGNVPVHRILSRYNIQTLQDLSPQQAEEALKTCKTYAQKLRAEHQVAARG